MSASMVVQSEATTSPSVHRHASRASTLSFLDPTSSFLDGAGEDGSCSVCGTLLGKRRLKPRCKCNMCGRTVCGGCRPSSIQLADWKAPQGVCSQCVDLLAKAPTITKQLSEMHEKIFILTKKLKVNSGCENPFNESDGVDEIVDAEFTLERMSKMVCTDAVEEMLSLCDESLDVLDLQVQDTVSQYVLCMDLLTGEQKERSSVQEILKIKENEVQIKENELSVMQQRLTVKSDEISMLQQRLAAPHKRINETMSPEHQRKDSSDTLSSIGVHSSSSLAAAQANLYIYSVGEKLKAFVKSSDVTSPPESVPADVTLEDAMCNVQTGLNLVKAATKSRMDQAIDLGVRIHDVACIPLPVNKPKTEQQAMSLCFAAIEPLRQVLVREGTRNLESFSYGESDLKPLSTFLMTSPSRQEVLACSVCASPFGNLKMRRRHHCRICKKDVCSRCSVVQRSCTKCVSDSEETALLTRRLLELSARLGDISKEDQNPFAASLCLSPAAAMDRCELALGPIQKLYDEQRESTAAMDEARRHLQAKAQSVLDASKFVSEKMNAIGKAASGKLDSVPENTTTNPFGAQLAEEGPESADFWSTDNGTSQRSSNWAD